MPDWLTAIVDAPYLGVILRVLVILVLSYLGQLGLKHLARHVERRVTADAEYDEGSERLKTLVRVIRGVLTGVLLVVAGLMILQTLGVDIVPLLASAGVAGLAISLGAQTLVKDYINGILILVEHQFSVGDTIRVGEHQGEVERMTLRATFLRDVDGRQHIVPNGEIRAMSNLTVGWSRAVVDVNVSHAADMNEVMRAFESAAANLRADPDVAVHLLDVPRVIGWNAFSDWAIQVRVMVKTMPGKQWSTAAALRRHVLEALAAANVPVALPRQEIRIEAEGESHPSTG
jgi:small conductance mechanosensitive channel